MSEILYYISRTFDANIYQQDKLQSIKIYLTAKWHQLQIILSKEE